MYIDLTGCILLFLITASKVASPVFTEYPAKIRYQCGQDMDKPDEQMMKVLQNLQQRLSVYTDCKDAYQNGASTSGVYTINPDNQRCFQVFCDMETDGGGWTVFQQRMDGSVKFQRNWTDYENGFGNLKGEYWMGLDNIHRLSSSSAQELRVDLEDFENNTAFALYKTFSIASVDDKYRLLVSDYTGTAGDAISYNSGHQFTTIDQDNDSNGWCNCAVPFKGPWWHRVCTWANLNGQYYHSLHVGDHAAITWYFWKNSTYSMKRVSMMLRRK